MNFSSLEKYFIAWHVKKEVDKLVESWEKPIKLREKAILAAVADAIVNLPSDEN